MKEKYLGDQNKDGKALTHEIMYLVNSKFLSDAEILSAISSVLFVTMSLCFDKEEAAAVFDNLKKTYLDNLDEVTHER
jgi:hypothetical protein